MFKKVLSIISILTLFLGISNFANAQSESFEADKGIDIYYTETCPHCRDARAWMATLEDIDIDYFLLTDDGVASELKGRLEEKGQEKSLGIVPAIFVNDGEEESLFIGFNNAETTGADILAALNGDHSGSVTKSESCDDSETCGVVGPQAKTVSLPFVGEVNTSKYSLGFLAVMLGFLDGFNVCSLGALALILGIAISLGSRKKTIIYGTIFLLITGVVYAALIYLWYAFFEFFSSWFRYLEYIVAAIGIIGGLYFLKEFIRMKTKGVTCDSAGMPIVGSITTWVQNTLKNKKGAFVIIGAIAAFAATLTIVEFPCSAAVPVMFAGILSAADLSGLGHVFYMSLFMLFYLLDEIIIFGIAAYKLNVWMMKSTKSIVWFTLAEAIILIALGVWYLI